MPTTPSTSSSSRYTSITVSVPYTFTAEASAEVRRRFHVEGMIERYDEFLTGLLR